MSRATDPEILSAYFATMRQFLATQSRVMGAFLGQPPAAAESPAPGAAFAAASICRPTANDAERLTPLIRTG